MTRSRKYKKAQKILKALGEKAPLSNDKGKIVFAKYPRSRKVRKHSGRRFPKIFYPQMKWSDIIKEALEPNSSWDDWKDHRDGMRAIWSEKWKKYQWKKSDKVYKQIELRKKRKGKKNRWMKKLSEVG